jgi:hypothetical protein
VNVFSRVANRIASLFKKTPSPAKQAESHDPIPYRSHKENKEAAKRKRWFEWSQRWLAMRIGPPKMSDRRRVRVAWQCSAFHLTIFPKHRDESERALFEDGVIYRRLKG